MYVQGILGYTEDQVVSTDFLGDDRSSIFDAKVRLFSSRFKFNNKIDSFDNKIDFFDNIIDYFDNNNNKIIYRVLLHKSVFCY